MSVIDVRDNSGGGNNLLGMLGGLATLGGTLTGQGWLTGLGTGLETMNGMMNGTAKKEDIKNLGDSYENTLAQFDKVDTAQTQLLIDLAEQFDEKIVATAKEKGVVLIDGMTFATTLIYHKV